MESVTAKKREGTEPGAETRPHLGSEYTDAPTYLSQPSRARVIGGAGKKLKNQPQHGLNDSDFGAGDQTPD